MSVAERLAVAACTGCGATRRELEHDQYGDLLCLECYSRRHASPEGYTPTDAPESQRSGAEPTTWEPVDLRPIVDAVVAGEHPDEKPTVLRWSDGIALLYAGRLHLIYAEPEAGKGWISLHACVEQLNADRHVVYIDYEDTAANIVARLVALGVHHDQLLELFHYVRPDEPAHGNVLEQLRHLSPAFVLFDGFTEGLALEGLDMMSNQDIAAFYKRHARPFTAAGACVSA